LDNCVQWAVAPHDDNVKLILLAFTNLTLDEYQALYNTDDQTSLGYRVQQLYQQISYTYNCADPTLCTDKELTLMQWASGNVTLNPDQTLAQSNFMGAKDKCITKAWGGQVQTNFFCPEYVNYAPNGFVFNDIVAPGLIFNKERSINLDDTVSASIVTSFIMNHENSQPNNEIF
jgi:hypothetical protein